MVGILTGCYSTLDGRSKMGTPAFVKSDKIVSKYARSLDEVHAAARKVIEYNGVLTGDDRVINTLTGIIDTSMVQVRMESLEEGVTQVVVMARTKNGGTDLPLAAEIDKQIALQLPRF